MSPRRLDPALWLSAVIAAVVVIASLLVYDALATDDRNQRRDATAATTELVAARLEARLSEVLSTLETAASLLTVERETHAPATGLVSRTLSLQARGVITASPTEVDDDHPTFSDPELARTFNAARDGGDARLGLNRERLTTLGMPELVAVAPVYRGSPGSTEKRREARDGFVIASVDATKLVEDSLPPDIEPHLLRLTDQARIIASVSDGGENSNRPQAQHSVAAGGATYLLTVAGEPAPTPFPALPLAGALLAALIGGVGAVSVRARRRAEYSAMVRDQELSLLANLGALLQASLDLEMILPAAALRLSEQLDLDGFAVLRADRQGRLVHAFALGAAPAGRLATVADIRPSPEVVEAGADALFPLQRAGRVTGALWLRPRRRLNQASVRSVHAAADLMAAALANADAFEQERESVRRLEDLDRIKNRFIGTVSHEMRTSASAISGFANLLSSRWDMLDDDERRDLVTRIDRNGQSLVSVVEDFLDFSRLERRSPASDPPPASLSDLVSTAVDDLAGLAPKHHVVTHIAPHVAAFVDRPAVERILANLVSNAAKYSPAGSQITITVDGAGETALLTVDDEGSGIPPDEREKVFEAFYRAGHHSVAGTHGAGIGLAVVKEVVDRLRARVSVEDSPSGGARLVVAFRAVSSPLSRSALLTGATDDH